MPPTTEREAAASRLGMYPVDRGGDGVAWLDFEEGRMGGWRPVTL
jgi:hypothetical protein